jgi:hypothetical protein
MSVSPAAGTRILSFDVGIRNLAFCELRLPPRPRGTRIDLKGASIEQWDMIDLEKVTSVEGCCKRLTDELYRRFGTRTYDMVLVERQPKNRSIMMVAIQMFLCSYFNVTRAVSHGLGQASGDATPTQSQNQNQNQSQSHGGQCVRFIHAGRKLELCEDPDPGQQPLPAQARGRGFRRSCTSPAARREQAERYKSNKRRAIETCERYLIDVLEDFGSLALLQQYSKKDDLCDAFLQAVAYLGVPLPSLKPGGRESCGGGLGGVAS